MKKKRLPDEILEQEGESTEEITTSVDKLLELLKNQDKMALEDVAQALGVDLDVVQSWVDFLVEEQIIGIEYKFTKPFIYLNETNEPDDEEEERVSLSSIKTEFINKAKEKNIPDQNINFLWRNHIKQGLSRKKEFFIEEAIRRELQDPEDLWRKYEEKIMEEA